MMSFAAMAAVGSVGHATGAPPPAPAVSVVLEPAVPIAPAVPTEPALAPPELAPALLVPAALVVPLLPATELVPAELPPAVLGAPAPPGAPPFAGVLVLELDEQADEAHNDNKSGRQRLVLFIDTILTQVFRSTRAFPVVWSPENANGDIVAALSQTEPAKLPLLGGQFASRDNHFMVLDGTPRGRQCGPRLLSLF